MQAPATIDLRSDTVTRPSAGMRKAMAEAEVGDDVYGEDPTVDRLQRRVAELLGVEAALLVPSGTMANQIALATLTRPGHEVIVGARAHNWLFETGAAAAINGVQHCVLPGDGRFGADAVRESFKPDNHHYAATRVVSVENTHNMGGGLVWSRRDLDAVTAAAHELGLATHLDGARLWNAAIAGQCELAELCRGFDTIAVCLSKGLGAPIGSLVCGDREQIHEAHRMRKMLGGGMRQAGIIAAAGLYALDHHLARLADDHRRARSLGQAVASMPGLTLGAAIDTNIVLVDLEGDTFATETLIKKAAARGLRFSAVGARRVRMVTHLDIDDAAIDAAVAILEEIVGRA